DPTPCPHSTTASPQPASPAPPLPDWNECSALPQSDDAHRGYSDPNNLASRRAHPAAPDPAVRYAPPPSGHCRTSSFALCAPASNGIRSGHARGSARCTRPSADNGGHGAGAAPGGIPGPIRVLPVRSNPGPDPASTPPCVGAESPATRLAAFAAPLQFV